MNLEDIKKTNTDFSFIETVADMAVNKDFTRGYRSLLDGNNNETTFIWNALSAIGQDVSETIYENILNYINNVSNIDTCNVKALKSMCQVLGVSNYGILQNLNNIPNEVLQLIDIFSINKKYLETLNFSNTKFYKDLVLSSNETNEPIKESLLSSMMHADLSIELGEDNCPKNYKIIDGKKFSTDEYNINLGFSEDAFEKYIVEAFSTLIKNNLSATYDGQEGSTDFIFKNLRSYLTQLDKGEIEKVNQNLDLPYRENVEALRRNLNLPISFNPYIIADNIDVGNDFITNYSGNEKYLILVVLDYRTKEKFKRDSNLSGIYESNRPLTKFSYYKEKKFIEYLKFINLYNNYLNFSDDETFLNNFETYSLDSNYSEIISTSANLQDLILELNNGSSDIIDKVAKTFKDICFAIVNIREKLKTQCQKNYMRGTFLLISYIINEYLKNTVKYQYVHDTLISNINEMTRDDIGIQEYDDITEYFNIKTDSTDLALNSNKVNARFWETESDSVGIGIAISEIDNFYLNTMNLKTSVSETRDFLDIIYSLGADKSYIDARTSSNVIITEEFDEIKSVDILNPEVEKQYNTISAYQYNMFLKYNGTEIGWNPYYNWKNETHSSYQIHPYLYNFIEHNNSYTSTIKNAFYNDANETLVSVLLSPEISTHIGEVGNILNIWKDDIIEYSGYRSIYEINSQSKDNDKIHLAEYYDGIFYPDAIHEFALSAQDDILLRELIFCIKHRLTGDDVFNGLRNSNSLLMVENEAVFAKSPFKLYIKRYNEELELLNTKINSNTFTEEEIEELSAEFENFKKTMPQTFYDKWYHFSNLMTKEAELIANSLLNNRDKILNLMESLDYDIYKYTIDKFGNNIFLYKRYNDINEDDFNIKLNTPGEIWFKKSGHPIGFPLDMNSSYDDTDEDLKLFYLKNNHFKDSYNIYDLEQSRDYKYLMLVAGETYDTADVIIYKPEVHSNFDTENKGEIISKYLWSAYDDKNKYTHTESKYGYKFSGVFQTGNVDVVIAYTSCDFTNNKIKIEEYVFPEDDFVKQNNYNIEFNSGIISSVYNSNYKLSFANNIYGIVWLSDIEKNNFVGSNYIGFNSRISKESTTVDNIRSSYYGEFNNLLKYTETPADDNEYNSFDIFDTYISFLEFNRSTLSHSLRYYNLNSDASYIPLYTGLNGFIRVWASSYYSKKDINNVELLGLSFNTLDKLESEFTDNIYEDEDGNFTADDPSEFVDAVARIFEQYNISATFKTFYNDILRLNEDGCYRWSEQLMDSITEDNLHLYNCFLYNIERGVTSPIITGTLDNIVTTYISTLTMADEYYWENGSVNTNYMSEVVGTPNIFKFSLTDETDSVVSAFANTNSIFGISSVTATYNKDTRIFDITFYPRFKEPDSAISDDIIIDANKLVLIINKVTLDEFSDYHYLTHHNLWPYRSNYSKDDFIELELSNYNSFDDPGLSAMFTTGNVVFKINEESDSRYLKYPNTALVDTITDIFKTNSTTYAQLSNIFSTTNTYVLELEKPKVIADIIGTVKIDVYNNAKPSFRVTEEFLRKIYSLSKYESEIFDYLRIFEKYKYENIPPTVKVDAGAVGSYIERVIDYTITEEDVQDFLKLYVNYTYDDVDGITLYFNYNNLFCSPYLYRRNNGLFSVIFKQHTFKKIKPGENDNLDIIVQIRYHNFMGEVCGVKDIPVLSYKIYNVSDDKPKFIIKNNWILSKEKSEYIVDIPVTINSATLFIENSEKDFTDEDELILDNYTLAKDVIVTAYIYVQSKTKTTIKSSSCDLIYEFSNKDIEFLESMSSGAGFINRNGIIHIVTYNDKFKIAFKIKEGTFINENGIYKIPIDAMNFKAINNVDLEITDLEIIPGEIVVKFANDNIAQYLGKDTHDGFIESVDNKLIQIFRNKFISVGKRGE